MARLGKAVIFVTNVTRDDLSKVTFKATPRIQL